MDAHAINTERIKFFGELPYFEGEGSGIITHIGKTTGAGIGKTTED